MALFPDGTRVSGAEAVATRLQSMALSDEGIQLEIGIIKAGEVTALWDFERTIPGTPYSVRISSERGDIGGCINRRNVAHVGLRVRDIRIPSFTGREVFNAHLVGWRESGRWCVGLYVTAKMWTRTPLVCQRVCFGNRPPSYSAQPVLRDALIAAGIASAAALIIAILVAPFLVFA
jgi:hypothetical protein